MTRPPLALPPSGLPFLPMLPRRRPTTLRACGVFARRSLPVVMITPGYALAPLTGTPGPANAHENPGLGRSSIHPTGGVDNEATFTTFSLLSLCCSKVGRFA
ncbi:hypothetical protein LINGRAHAP2_LOCUS37563 [Linum grandiflorum]